MMIYFINQTKRQIVFVGEAEGESVSDVYTQYGWRLSDNVIMKVLESSDLESYDESGYTNLDETSDYSSSESESELDSDSESETEDSTDDFRRRGSEETLTED